MPVCYTGEKIGDHGWLHSRGPLASQVMRLPEMVDVTVRASKMCRKCGVVRSLDKFGKMPRQEGRLSHTCRPCIAKRQKEWVQRRRERFDRRSIDTAALFKCAKCSAEKSSEAFFLQADKKRGLSSWCIECCRTQDRRRYAGDPEKRREQAKWGAVKSKFGLTRDQWMAMYDAQQGRCPICQEPMSNHPTLVRDKRGACVDHCHKTGRIRALLCNRCNQGLGLFRDNQVFVESAAAYLRRHANE